VHNGIIENFEEIKKDLLEKEKNPKSETDSELYGYLVCDEIEKGNSFVESCRKAFLKLEGSCSVVVTSDKEPGTIVGIRNGSPLVVAVDEQDGVFLASDAQPLLDYTQEVIFLENQDMVVATKEGFSFYSVNDGKPAHRDQVTLDWSADRMSKKGYPHYMLKEIYEQNLATVDTLNGLLDNKSMNPFDLVDQPGLDLLKNAKELILIACGTSWHAALLGKYWIESLAKVPVQVELASEFRYRQPVIKEGSLLVGISQSGETADTLAVIRDLKQQGIPTLGLTNVRGSTISREADATFYTFAGPEIGVAATKTFYTQLLVLLVWAGYLAQHKGDKQKKLHSDMIRIAHLLEATLERNSSFSKGIKEVAARLQNAKGFFFMGRGTSYPIALEGALKLKEITYIHAEGYAGGELKHGPIAMIDEGMVVVVLAPQDLWHDKMISNLQEVKARGAIILGVGNSMDASFMSQCDEWIPLPLNATTAATMDENLYPFFTTPVIQLLSYELAVLRGTDVDQPRNLAKSVTVE